MGLTITIAGLVALSLLAIGATLRGRASPGRTRIPPFRFALPWIAAAVLVMGAALLAVPGVPAIAAGGLLAYTAVAVAAVWRMVMLDRVSRWMTPSRRLARLGLSIAGLAWLGVVLGLLLRIADLVATTTLAP